MDPLIRVHGWQGFRWLASVSSRPFVEPRAEVDVHELGRRTGGKSHCLRRRPKP